MFSKKEKIGVTLKLSSRLQCSPPSCKFREAKDFTWEHGFLTRLSSSQGKQRLEPT